MMFKRFSTNCCFRLLNLKMVIKATDADIIKVRKTGNSSIGIIAAFDAEVQRGIHNWSNPEITTTPIKYTV